MGTNYYRIPLEAEMEQKKRKLIQNIQDMILTPGAIENGFALIQKGEWDWISPWEEFLNDVKIHLGKGSGGWKFCWNFNKNKYYSNKEELFKFIRSGRVVSEYGELIDSEEFIKDALEWGGPDGYVYNEEYVRAHPSERSIFGPEYYSKIIDGLVVSAHDEFC